MTGDILKGKWKQLKGEVQKQWGDLTNDDLDVINGERTKLEGKLQEKYGLKKEEVRRELDEFMTKHGK